MSVAQPVLFPLCRESCLAWTLPTALQPVLSSSLPSEIILNSHCLLQVPHSHHPARPQQVALPASSFAENVDAGMAPLLQRPSHLQACLWRKPSALLFFWSQGRGCLPLRARDPTFDSILSTSTPGPHSIHCLFL